MRWRSYARPLLLLLLATDSLTLPFLLLIKPLSPMLSCCLKRKLESRNNVNVYNFGAARPGILLGLLAGIYLK